MSKPNPDLSNEKEYHQKSNRGAHYDTLQPADKVACGYRHHLRIIVLQKRLGYSCRNYVVEFFTNSKYNLKCLGDKSVFEKETIDGL